MNLFQKFIQYKSSNVQSMWDDFQKNKVIQLDKNDVIDEGIFKFRHLKRSGFCTFYTGLSFWNINSEYFVESRKASERVEKFTRIFIIKDIRDLENKYLFSQIQADLSAHTRVYICFYDDIPLLEAKKDFGIWDEEYVCIVHYNYDNEVTGITISGRNEDIQKAKEWQKVLLSVAQPIINISEIEKIKQAHVDPPAQYMSDRNKEFQLKSIELQMSIA